MIPKRTVNNAKNWIEMAGETYLEKRLNSLLTVSFIGVKDVEPDACLQHALVLIELRAHPEMGPVNKFLEEAFGKSPSEDLLNKIDMVFEKWKKERESSTHFQ